MKELFLLSRPNHWAKNLSIFFPVFFSFNKDISLWLISIQVLISFCLISSSIYLINDLIDVENDRKHPKKKFRPIALGLISPEFVIRCSLIYTICALLLIIKLDYRVSLILIIYYLAQISYCLIFKNFPVIEFLFFVFSYLLRPLAGAIATGLDLSFLLIFIIVIGSLILIIEKRKAEIFINIDLNYPTRKVLKEYSIPIMNRVLFYLYPNLCLIYMWWSFGSNQNSADPSIMVFTIPLFILGLYRYKKLGEYKNGGLNKKIISLENPESVFYKDKYLALLLSSWITIVILIGFL